MSIESKAFEAYKANRELKPKYHLPENMWIDWFVKGYERAEKDMDLQREQLSAALAYIYFGNGKMPQEQMNNKRVLVFSDGVLRLLFAEKKVYALFFYVEPSFRKTARIYDYEMNVIKQFKTVRGTDDMHEWMLMVHDSSMVSQEDESGIDLRTKQGFKLESGVYVNESMFCVFNDLMFNR